MQITTKILQKPTKNDAFYAMNAKNRTKIAQNAHKQKKIAQKNAKKNDLFIFYSLKPKIYMMYLNKNFFHVDDKIVVFNRISNIFTVEIQKKAVFAVINVKKTANAHKFVRGAHKLCV